MPQTSSLPIIAIEEDRLEAAGLSATNLAWAAANSFTGQLGRLLALPGGAGEVTGYLFGMGKAEARSALVLGLAGAALAEGDYHFEGAYGDPVLAAVGFRLGAYRFDRYCKGKPAPRLVAPADADAAEIDRLVDAAVLARDLINTPTNDLGPDAFDAAIRDFADKNGMRLRAIVGDDLLAANFPMIHAVGRAATQQPRRKMRLFW